MPALPTPLENVPARIDPDHETTRRSAAEIKALLDARQNDLQFRVQAIKDELTNPSSITLDGQPLPDALRDHALRYAAIALATGAALGVLWGLLKRSRPEPEHDLDLVRAKVSTFLDDAAEKVRRGASSAEAVRQTLRDTPVVYAPPPAQQASAQAKSSVRQAVDFAVKSAAGFAVKAATDQVKASFAGTPGDAADAA